MKKVRFEYRTKSGRQDNNIVFEDVDIDNAVKSFKKAYPKVEILNHTQE